MPSQTVRRLILVFILFITTAVVFLFSMSTRVESAVCIPDLGSGNICSANDFQLSQTLITGPTDCTEGEILPQPITLRIGMIPTANQRYQVGLFVGDDGGPAIEGESCTFISLTPVENGSSFDALSGHGPYRNLDGNQCGDTLKNDGLIYRDITLNNVLCKDSDGNGKADVSYAVTWQNQSGACSDPDDPENFFPPSSSKCILDVGNISEIEVLPPPVVPAVEVTKSASPDVISAPGHTVVYSFNVENSGTEEITLTALNDDILGNISGQGNCSVPQTLAPGETYHCQLESEVTGNAGDVITNTVTATGENGSGVSVTDTDNASVTIIAPAQPSASIGNLVWDDLNGDGIYDAGEPGISGASIRLQRDDGAGYADIASTTTDSAGRYTFTELPAGSYRVIPEGTVPPLADRILTGGIVPHDVILADNQQYRNADFGFAQAKIAVFKGATPNVVNAPSASVTYDVTVTNIGPLPVILADLVDNRFGGLFSECSLPKILAPGDHYTCQFTETISGQPGDVHENFITALALDYHRNVVMASDSAKVLFADPADASIGHMVWNDINGDGIADPGEPTFDYVTLELTGASTAETVTSNGGTYWFQQLTSGSYTVTVTDKNSVLQGYLLTTNNQPYNKNLAVGEKDNNANFGYAKGEISISKTADKSVVFAVGQDVVFSFYISNTGSVELEVDDLNDDQFGNLNSDCGLPKTLAPGDSFTCQITRHISGAVGDTHTNTATVTADDSAANEYEASDSCQVNLIGVSGGAIGHLVWYDANGDGIRESDEVGINGITLDLIQNGQVLHSTITANDGQYAFLVANGDYEVEVTDNAHILDGAILTGGVNPYPTTINHNIDLGGNFGYDLPVPPPVIAKTDDVDPVKPGENLTYTIHYENATTGTGTATNVVITETYDPNVTFLSASPAPDAGTNNQWTIGDLAPGESGTIQVTVKVNTPLPDGTRLLNRVVLTSDQGSSFSREETTVQSKPILQIEKIDNPDPVMAGDNLIYRIIYSNATSGTETATNVVITEAYDPNVTFVSATPAPDAGTNNQWTIGDLAPGESGIITLTVKVNSPVADGTELLNTVVMTSDHDNVDAQEITTVHSKPLITINKIDYPDPVKPGNNLTYLITYSNRTSGTETATNVVITETYDPNVTFVSATPAPDSGTNNQWTIGDLAPEEWGIIIIKVQVDTPLPNGTQIVNGVAIDSDQSSSNSQEVTTVQSHPVLAISKTDSTDPIKPGENLTYTISYSNDASATETATNVVITETYDPNVTYVSATPAPDAGTNNQWTIGSLAPGASGIITVTVRVNSPLSNGIQLLNSVVINSDQGTSNSQEVTTVQSNPILRISKIDDPDPVSPGDKLTYTITYSNDTSGTETATNVVVTETYDPNVTFVSADPAPDSGTNNQWTIGNLAPGESGTIKVTVKVTSPLSDGTQLINSVVIDSDQGISIAQEITTVVTSEPAELGITKTDSPDPVRPGDNLTYTITYKNQGTGDATNVVITETYDPNVTFVSATPAPDAGTNNQWTIGSLAPGASGTITVTVKVKSPLAGGTQIVNTVVINSDQGSSSAQAVTTVKSGPILTLDKTDHPDPVKRPDGKFIYTITYSNKASAGETATNVVITETYDPNVIFVSANPAPDSGTNNQWTIGDLAPGESGTITVIVKVDTSLNCTPLQLVNTVELTSDQDSVSAQEVTTFECPEIPTLDQWGMLILSLLLGWVAIYSMRARKRA